jgi:hypothetical protein
LYRPADLISWSVVASCSWNAPYMGCLPPLKGVSVETLQRGSPAAGISEV